MYRALLSDYEVRQQALMQENVELKKLLHNMKKDMVSILSRKTHCSRSEDSLEQVQTRRILWSTFLHYCDLSGFCSCVLAYVHVCVLGEL